MAGDGALAGAAAGVAVDPNWLLSTAAQSAAAIVAIVGGFLVSRVVGLAGEVGELRRRIRDLDGQHKHAVAERSRLANEREDPLGLVRMQRSIQALASGMVPSPAEETADEKAKRERDLGVEARSVAAERARVEATLSAVQRPRGLWWGIGVLTYFGLVGTVFPLVLMSRRPVPATSGWRTTVVVLFISGFLAVAGYVISLIAQLPKGSTRTT